MAKPIFSGRTFEEAAEFTEARFCYPPDFDAATNAARIDFTSANIGFVPPGRRLHWTSDTKVPLRLRAAVMRSKNPALARHPGNPLVALHSA